MNLIASLENFLTHLRVHKGRSMRTLEQYEFHIWRFFTFIDRSLLPPKNEMGKDVWNHRKVFLDNDAESRDKNRAIRKQLQDDCSFQVENVRKENVDEFRLDLIKDGLSIKSVNAHIITFRSWLKYLKKEWLPVIDPTLLDLIKPPDREVVFLTDTEIGDFFESIPREDIQSKRDYAICQCIYSTGLRISELTSLDRSDVNLETLEFAVRGKWSKIRVVYLTEMARDAIRDYLEERQDGFSPLFIRHNFGENTPVTSLSYKHTLEKNIFTDNESVRLSRFFITNMIKDYGRKAWILKNLHAHTLRHSFATTLLTNGADIRIIQELLWHASITTTQVYTHVTNPKLKEAHKKFHK